MPRGPLIRPADAAWLGVDRPENPMVVTAVLVLHGTLGVDAFRTLVADRVVAAFPRFGRRVEPAGVPLLPGRWVDADVDLTWHVAVEAGPALDDVRLRRAVGRLVSTPMDLTRPPWRMHLLDLADGGTAVVVRLHHSLADGIALAGVLLGLTDPVPGGGPQPAPRSGPAPRTSLLAPVRVAGSVLTTVVRTLATLGEPVTALRAPTGPDKVVGWTTPRPLAPVQQASRARAVSVNDLLLAAASGGLRAHLLATGSPVGDLRVLVPVDLRGGRPVGPDLGNRFGVVFVPLPVGEAARDRRVELVQRATRTLRGSAQAGATYVVLTVVGLLPSPLQQLAVNLLGASASAVVTNVPGPRGAIEVAGHRVQDVVFWVPQVGRVGLGISLFSYAGTLSVGVALDAGSGLDPQALAVAIDDELTALTAAAPDA